jgi:hypothetical protein
MLLLAASTALFIGNWTRLGLVQPHDPVLQLSMRNLFWIVGALGLVAALVCLFGRRAWAKLGLILWLTSVLLVYQVALQSTTACRNFSFFLIGVARPFALTPGAAYWLARIGLVGLWLGSLAGLLWLWRGNRSYLKCACSHCGGNISFPSGGIGRQIDCPHCAAKAILRVPPET